LIIAAMIVSVFEEGPSVARIFAFLIQEMMDRRLREQKLKTRVRNE
jgi:hypothetical protein